MRNASRGKHRIVMLLSTSMRVARSRPFSSEQELNPATAAVRSAAKCELDVAVGRPSAIDFRCLDCLNGSNTPLTMQYALNARRGCMADTRIDRSGGIR